jgi:uncharacterized protein YndB with AHSA1/START domain
MSAEKTETGATSAAAPDKPSACCGGKLSVLKKIFLGLILVVAALAAVIALQPADYRIERTATMSAPPAAPFAQVNDFHNWEAWSPWLEADPQAKVTFEGPPSGPGAIYRWEGNDQVGSGSMTLLESRPNELIRIQLEFLKPFPGAATAQFTFEPEGDQTVVTWSMFGKNGFTGKAIHLVMNMDKMIGDQFDKGLAKMKTVVEAGPEKEAASEGETESETKPERDAP